MSRYQELENWLSKATAGLCDEAKVRIATEIECHVRAAVADLREQGIDEADAMRRAVATLGNVKKARRAFRRIHLTEWEAKTVQALNPDAPPDLPLPYAFVPFYFMLVPLFLIGIIVAIRDASVWLLIGTLGAPVAIGMLVVVAWRVSQRPRPKRDPARIIMGTALIDIVGGIMLSIPWPWPYEPYGLDHAGTGQVVFDVAYGLLVLLGFWFFAYRYLRLWRKLIWPGQPSSGMYTGFQDGHT